SEDYNKDSSEDYNKDLKEEKEWFYDPNGGAIRKIMEVVRLKDDAMMSFKSHKYSYCQKKDTMVHSCSATGTFGNFENILCSVYSDAEVNSGQQIELYQFCFEVSGPRLFEAKGNCKIYFKDGEKSEIVSEQTSICTRSRDVTLIIQGEDTLELKLSLGDKMNMVEDNKGNKFAVFEPVLNVEFDKISYSVLVFVVPPGMSKNRIDEITDGFSKIMSDPEVIEEFQLLSHMSLSNFQYDVQDTSSNLVDQFFPLLSPWIKEQNSNTVEVYLCTAWQGMIPDESGVAKLNYRYFPQMPQRSFPSKYYHDLFGEADTGGPEMKKVFEESLTILQHTADLVAKGVNLNEIRKFTMDELKNMFQEHRRMVGNKGKFQEANQFFMTHLNNKDGKAEGMDY
ncbi:hypothetical protein NPIL_622021, partial [Nephila pilipes]